MALSQELPISPFTRNISSLLSRFPFLEALIVASLLRWRNLMHTSILADNTHILLHIRAASTFPLLAHKLQPRLDFLFPLIWCARHLLEEALKLRPEEEVCTDYDYSSK